MDKYTIQEAAKYFGIPEHTVYLWVRKNRLIPLPRKSKKPSCKIYLSKDTLDEFMKENELEISFHKNKVPEGYLTTDLVAEQLGVNRHDISHWIRQGRFKNVKKSGVPRGASGYYLIPKQSVIDYEAHIKNLQQNYVKTKEATKILGITQGTLLRWEKTGIISTGISWLEDKYFKSEDINNFKMKLDAENKMITLKEAESMLNIPSAKIVDLIDSNKLKNSIKGKRKLITKDDFDHFVLDNQWLITYYQTGSIPAGYYSSSMLAERYNEPQLEIVRWINQGRFKDVKKFGATSNTLSFFVVPESSVLEYENHLHNLSENYAKSDQAKDMLGMSQSTIGNWLKDGKLPGSVMWLDAWYIPLETIDKLIKTQTLKTQLLTFRKACSLLKTTRKTINKWIEHGLLKVIIVDSKKYLDIREVESFTKDAVSIPSIKDHGTTEKPDEFLTVNDVALRLQISNNSASLLFRQGVLGTIVKCRVNSRVVNTVQEEHLKLYMESLEIPEDYMSTKEAAVYLGGILYNTVCGFVNQGYFPHAIKKGKKYYIPKNDLDEYMRKKAVSKLPTKRKKKNRTNKISPSLQIASASPPTKSTLLKQLLQDITLMETPPFLSKTKALFLEYSSIRISSLNGRISSLKGECGRIKKTFQTIILGLPTEASSLSDEDIEKLLQNNSYPVGHRTFVNWFFQFVFQKMGVSKKRSFVISPTSTKDHNKEIYPPEIYLQYLSYAKEIDLHVPEAIKSQEYANMWLFTIMHLMDAWRPSDIVNNLPPISTEDLQIEGMDWLLSNELSIDQAQIIINQVYIKTRHSSASKTNALLTFLVPLDFVQSAGTAFLICELHRREYEEPFLLQTLLTENHNARKPNKRHLNFFKFNSKLLDFRSLVMIRSTMTYLFNSIVEGSPDPELALTYTQNARSHVKEDSTAVYIQATNYDGSLNRVALHLFKRGHFGWLFNTLIKLMVKDKDIYQTIEDRTSQLMEFRTQFTPSEIENWAAYLRRIQSKRQPIIGNLRKLSQGTIREMIGQILRGEKPARHENGQCLTYPTCETPTLRSCYYCGYFIPQLYLLIHVKHELDRLITSIETTQNVHIVQRCEC